MMLKYNDLYLLMFIYEYAKKGMLEIRYLSYIK